MKETNSATPASVEPTSDFPLAAPFNEGEPLEWSEQAIVDLAKQSPEELNSHIAKLLSWYVEEDDVIKGMPGNEYWVVGHNMAKALLAARELQQGSKSA